MAFVDVLVFFEVDCKAIFPGCSIRNLKNSYYKIITVYISGERLLNLNNVKFLALDWKNNPKTKGYVKVTEKKQVAI